MGSVWLCRDELLGRVVAVKQVGGLPGESTPDLARAMREARSSAALNHPHVVAVYDAIEEGDHFWLVMEYVPGRTLAEIMAAGGPAGARARRVDRRPGGRRAGRRPPARHRAPRRQAGQHPGHRRRPRQDLRLRHRPHARRHPADRDGTGLSGTPAYFSPEVARGEESSPASDVWALGATLYGAVEGHPPYPHQANALATLATIASQRPAAPVRAGILAEPIGRMLDPDPASRWDMADAAHALRRLHERHARSGTREEVRCRGPADPTRPAVETIDGHLGRRPRRATPAPTTAAAWPAAARGPRPAAAPHRRGSRLPVVELHRGPAVGESRTVAAQPDPLVGGEHRTRRAGPRSRAPRRSRRRRRPGSTPPGPAARRGS